MDVLLVEKDRLVTTAGARPGDAVLLTKGVAVEGSSILAREPPAVRRQPLLELAQHEYAVRGRGYLQSREAIEKMVGQA